MPFINKLEVIQLDGRSNSGRGRWQLLENLEYDSELTGKKYTVPAGFSSDFATVPRLPLIFALVGNTASAPAALHDYLYWTHVEDRKTSDRIFREAASGENLPKWRVFLLYWGVRLFGGSHWN